MQRPGLLGRGEACLTQQFGKRTQGCPGGTTPPTPPPPTPGLPSVEASRAQAAHRFPAPLWGGDGVGLVISKAALSPENLLGQNSKPHCLIRPLQVMKIIFGSPPIPLTSCLSLILSMGSVCERLYLLETLTPKNITNNSLPSRHCSTLFTQVITTNPPV